MKNLNLSFTLIVFSLFFSNCKHADDLVTSYGDETTETREVESFDKILAGEKFDIELVQDSAKAGTIEMTAGSNVIKGYTTKVNNGELIIANDNKYNWVRKLKVRQKVVVYFETLNKIQINGSAKFTCRDSISNKGTLEIKHGGLEDADLLVKGDYVFVDCTNTGGVNLEGSCFLLSASIDDISFVNSYKLNAEKTYISSFSKDDSYIFGRNIIDIKLWGTGNIHYRDSSNTSVNIIDTGEGQVIKD
jgi:hypothetical protein